MHKVNSLKPTKTIIKTPHSKQEIPGNTKMVIPKWINISFPYKKSSANLLEDKNKQITTQALSHKIDRRTVNNLMNNDEYQSPDIEQITKIISLPHFAEFKSILKHNNDEDLLPGIDQITEIIILPPCAKILGKNEDYTALSQGEDAVPSIHCMLPYEDI
jgi:hypothetical protein